MADPLVIAPKGDLDLAATRDLAPRLNEAAGQLDSQVVIDLSGVSFMDSSALGAVVQADARLQRNGRRLSVVAPTGSPAAILMALGSLQDHLLLFGTCKEAIDAAAE